MKGTINRYLAEKRYGFITQEETPEQVFFHQSVFETGVDGPPPITGEPVEFAIGETTRATSVHRMVVPVHHTGTVRSYDPVKGYGFIQTSDGQFYMHKSEVIGGIIPAVGSKVDFYTSGNPIPGKSPRACYVTVLQ
jgi:cold shock CspA family protein